MSANKLDIAINIVLIAFVALTILILLLTTVILHSDDILNRELTDKEKQALYEIQQDQKFYVISDNDTECEVVFYE